jgi:type II secretory pathway pseudopilin PulG
MQPITQPVFLRLAIAPIAPLAPSGIACRPTPLQRQAQRGLQQGFVAVFLIVMIAVAAMTALTANLWGGSSTQNLEREKTRAALQVAKEALLNYIELGQGASDANLFDQIGGRLPCANLNGSGLSDNGTGAAQCGLQNVSRVGLFPFATVGTPAPRDGSGECLWLVVGGSFKQINPVNTTNADSNGHFSIIQPFKQTNSDGRGWSWNDRFITGDANNVNTNPTGPNRAVAIIIAPGKALNAQIRRNANNQPCPLPAVPATDAATNFLDSYTSTNTAIGVSGVINNAVMPAAGIGKVFVQADRDHELLNDELIWINSEEFGRAATKRALNVAAAAIKNFVYGNGLLGEDTANGFYPPPAATPGGVCVPGRLQGYIPSTCNTPVSLLDWNVGNRLNLNNNKDPERWLSQIHYAVSEHCDDRPPTAVNVSIQPPSPCHGGPNRLRVGNNTNTYHALLLIRGRDPLTANCTTVTANNVALPTLAPCMQDIDNRNRVIEAGVNPLQTITSNLQYQLPQPNSRNQMYLFRPR